jgi:hypothetical protein
MKWNWIASGLIVVMLTYFVVDNHIELYPWNNLVSSQLPSTLAALIPFAVYAAAFALAPSLADARRHRAQLCLAGAANSAIVDSVPVRTHCFASRFRVVFR